MKEEVELKAGTEYGSQTDEAIKSFEKIKKSLE